jgi:hypothetical protein
MLNNIAAITNSGLPPEVGDYESIATTTLSTAAADITFSSIPSTYKHLQIRCLVRSDLGSADAFKVQFNGVTSASYSYHYLGGQGSSAYAGSGVSTTFMQGSGIPGTNATSGIFGVSVFDLLDYTSTNKQKTLRSLGGFDSNGAGVVEIWSGAYYPGTIGAITSIKLFPFFGPNFVTNSSFALYGIN